MSLDSDPLGLYQSKSNDDPLGLYPSTEPAKPASAARKMGDLGLSVAKGVIAVPEAAVGLADLVTGGRAGKAAEGMGVRFKDAKDILSNLQSDDLKGKQQQFQQADGVLDKAGVAVSNPSLITNAVAESVPLMGAGGVGARGIMAAIPKAGAVGAGAVGEGIVGAGSAAEQIRQETGDGLLTGKQAALAGASGVATAAFGAAGGKASKALGIGDVDTMIARGATDVAQTAAQAEKGVLRRAAEGALSEGVLEELPQSLSEQGLQNIALDKPWQEGLEDAGVMGVLTGGAMGAGAGVMTGRQTQPGQQPAPPVPPAPPAPPAGLLGNTPDPLISFPDGTVGRRSEVDAYVASLPEDQQPAMRARLMGLAPQPAIPAASEAPVVEPVAPPSVQMGIDPSYGPLSRAAATAVDTGIAQEIEFNQATAEDQAAYDQAMAAQEQARAEQDSVDKPITSGAIAESQMSEADRRAVLFSNKYVEDGGARHVGTLDGDVLNGMGAPFATRLAAARRAKMEGKDWTIAPVFDGWVARRKDAIDGAGSGVSPAAAGSSEQGSDQPAPGVGSGIAANDGVGTDTGGRADDVVGEPLQSSGGVDDAAVMDGPDSSKGWVQIGSSNRKQQNASRDIENLNKRNDGYEYRVSRIDGADHAVERRKVGNVQNPTPAANDAQAEPASVETGAPVAGDAAPAADVPGAGSANLQADGVTGIEPWLAEFKRAKEADDKTALQDLYNKVRVSLNGPAQARGDDAVKQFEKLKSDIELYASKVSQSAQPGAPGQGAGVSQPTQAAPKKTGKAGPASLGSAKADMDHLFGVDKKRAAALDRIAAGNAWFSNPMKAADFITKNGLKETHKSVRTGPKRWDVREKAPVKDSLPVQSERETRIASTLASGGHVVGSDLRDRTGMRLMGLTPEELATIPADKVRAKPSAEAARTDSTTKGSEDGTQTDQTVETTSKQPQERTPGQPVAESLPPTDIKVGDTVLVDGKPYKVSQGIQGGIAVESEPVGHGSGVSNTTTKFLKGDDAIRAKIEADKAGLNEQLKPDDKPNLKKTQAKRKAAIEAVEAEEAKTQAAARADYFTPGNIVKSYGGHDEVLAYNAPTSLGGSWSVRVHAVEQRDGKWVRQGRPQDAREHSTQPEPRNLAAGPVVRLPYQPAAEVLYSEARGDGKPFQNAPDRGVKSEKKQVVAPVDTAPAATETVAKPDAKSALSDREKAAKAKMFSALGKLATLAGKNTRMNWTQEEEQQLLPIVIELFDGAMELGAVSFQQAVAYVRDFITTNLDSETADAIPFDTLQGAYISVAGRHKDKPVTPKKEVVGYESLDELALAKPAASADTPTEDTPNEPANPNQQDPQALEPVPAAENRGPESSGRVERGSAGRRARRKPDDSGLAEPGVSGTRSGGSGSTSVRAPAPRAGKRGRLGESGAGANGSAVPEAGRAQPVDLFSAPTEPVSAGNIQATNFRITEDLRLGQGGEAEKFRDNLAAIRTLKAIESEGRRATSEEQRTLARYVGWGGLSSAFPNPESKAWKDDWKTRGAELRELLTDKEYNLARRSTLDSHYTPQTVVTAMWDAARRLGFKGGLAAETSMGIGNFMGLMPEDVAGNTRFIGVEYDSLTARMAGLLYPQATVLHSGLQKVPMPDGAFDLNIGNPPFGDQSLRFQFKPEINRVSIHNQFFLAGVDALKPGGLQINVVSRYLLDAMDKTTRTMLAKKAKLVAAIRLPDTAFKENARTSVVTDIVILQRLTPAEESNMQAVFEAYSTPFKADKGAAPWVVADKKNKHDALVAQVPAWVEVAKVPDPLGGDAIPVNSYFAANPGNILGTLERSGKMQFKNDITVRPGAGELSELLAKVVERLPEGIMQRDQDAIQASIARHKGLSDALRISLSGQEAGSIALTPDGGLEQVYERETPEGDYELAKRAITPQSPWSEALFQDATGAWYTIEAKLDATGKPEKVTKNGKATNLNVYERKVFASEADIPEGMLLGQAKFDRLAKLVKLRDLMVNQISLETEDAPTLRMEGNRKKLAAAYKDFVGTEGFISKPANSALVANMPDGALVQALELSYRKAISVPQAKKMGEKARPDQADPAPILTERVIPKYEPPTKAASPADALSIVMAETGRVDVERMASLLGKTEAEVTAEMFDNADKPLIFKDPETSQWMTRNEYLTGQVKKKLHAAQAAGLQKHITELEAVQPEPWGAENVTVLLGATFVPPKIYADFILHMTGAPAKVSFSQVTNSYSVSPSGNATAAKQDEWGAEGISIANMISAMLNSTGIKVTTTDSDGNTVVDKERTELANLKARQIASEFTDWAFADGQRRKTLVGLFNEKYNTRVNRQHDGSHLTLPGKVPDAIISMRRHQKNAIWRGISERFMLLDHVVGAGKTFTAIARAMERRRMGLSRKPAIIVPNHMVEQFTSDVYRLYPGAKVLAAGKADFEKKRRRKVFAKIASGDWDVVIIPHSSFGFIGIAPETEERYLEQELVIAEQAIKDAWEESDDAPGGRRTPFNVKQAERLRDKITARMEGLKGKDRKDRLLTFEQMGIDDLTVDEAHEFKNLFYSSRLTNVKGMGNPSGSQKAFDLYSKVRVLRESPTGTVTFMTGTPISNSAVEMFTMMRYLAADELRELGLEHFDAWRSQFVSTDAGWEPTETGRLKEVNRLGRSWSNMRSLMDLYYSFTDSVGNEDIKKAYAEDNKGKQFPIPKVKGGDRQSVVVQPTPEQVKLLTDTMNEFDALPGIQDPYERNIARLKLMDRARKLSLDVRAAVPGHPSKEVGGKLDKISDEVKRIYDQWSDDKGTQLIFLDRSVPKSKGDDKIIKDYDALVLERNKAVAANDEDALRRATESLDKFDSNEVEELRASQAGGWNAYQQIKDNLIARGIPAGEIRFVQEANNDAQKQALFDQVKAGEVRVLIGSTPRMGAGTNVQDRLVALHHADVTWKPSDIEQREGRVIRQGNKLLDKYGIDNFEVEILAYATERTIDAKMWSLNSAKLKTINAIRNYDGSFSMDFDDDDSVSMAELAALASGNPMLLERVKLDSEINNLELLRKQHQRKTWGYVSRLEDAEKAIERATPDSERFTKLADQATIGAAELAEDIAARSVTVEGETFTSYAEAGKAVLAEIAKQQVGDDKAKFSVKVGERRLTSQNGALDALSDALGDADPFLATVNGTAYRGRTALAREVARLATDAAPNLTVGDSKVLATGKMLGFTFESSLSRSQYGGDYMVDMALVDADGKTVDAVTGRGQADTKFVTSSLTNPLSKLSDSINPERFKSRARGAVQDAERAKRELPELREKAALPFAKEGELSEKRARLSEVIAELSNDKAPAAPEAAPEDDTPAMSRARPAFSRGAQVQANESVETVAMAIASKWENTPEIVVAFDMNDPVIPENVRKEDQRQRSGGATGTPEGFYYKGVVYLMSSKLGTPNDVARVLFHEALGHAGLRGAFGGSLEPILREVSVMRRAEVEAKLKQYGLKGISNMDRMIAAEEVLAELAQTRPDIGFVKRAIAAIRTWLRQNVPGFASLRLTDAELIRNYILPARRFVENGGGPKGGMRVEPTFSRSTEQTQSDSFKRWFGDSKVVDADGKPLVVYHGTTKDFDAFSNGTGWFTSDPAEANFWGGMNADGANVMPAFMSLKNPRVLQASDASRNKIIDALEALQGTEDGVVVMENGKIRWAVASEPTQIKSATGNNGDFDSENPDIRFSRTIGETLTTAANNFVVPDVGKKFGNRLADFRGIALQALGRRQLVDIYGKDLPQLAAYSDMVAQMDADKNEAGAEADSLATEWGNLDESPLGGLAKHPGMERKLAELMHDATLAQIDPDKEFVAGDDADQYQALRDGFEQLSPKAQAAYRKARGMYADHNEKVRQAIRERIERSELSSAKRKALLERMDGEFFQKVKGVYFPLARFGQYLTIVKDSNGTVLNVSRSETLNEADETRKILLKEYPASGGFAVGKVLKEKEFNAARDGVGRGFMSDLFETLEKTEAGEELIDSISQLYLAALPDLSWAKHGIHRKGTPGFSQDARRAFAQNMFHGARYLAKLRYADQLQTHLDDMQEHIGSKSADDGFDSVKAQQVADEMVKRHDSMMNPESHPISTALTSFGFVFHLGLSPASAMVNLSQTALVALPVMGAKWGFGKSSAALLTASKQAASNRNDISKVLKGDELRAYNEAVRSGVIDVTMAHDLAGIAQGEDSKVAAKVRPVMKWASFLFHHAEKFNRQVTFVAAYRLAREAGAEHSKAYADAVKATYDGHFDYSASNRARLLQGNWQKVILLFKQYAQNMIYTLSRQAYQAVKAGTPQERKEARKALSGLLVAHAMAAGVLGLPVVGILLSAASMVGGDDDEPWDAKVALQNMLADTLGQKPAEVIAHGLSRLTPWDISGRVGLDKLLLPDIQEGLSGTPAAQAMLASAAGPVAGIGVNMVKGLAEMGEGQYQRGLESMMPTALRGPLKAYRFAAEGNIDKTGVPINDEVSAAGIAGQALGLSPSETRLAQEGKSAIYSADRAVQARRSDLMRAYAMAAIDSDAEGMAEARQKIANFNERNPQSRIMLMQLMASVRARKKRIEESKQGVYLPKKRQDAMEAGRFAVVD